MPVSLLAFLVAIFSCGFAVRVWPSPAAGILAGVAVFMFICGGVWLAKGQP